MKVDKGSILVLRIVKTAADLDKTWRVVRRVRGRQEDGKVGRSFEVMHPVTGKQSILTTMDLGDYEAYEAHGFVLDLGDGLLCDCGKETRQCKQCREPLACTWAACPMHPEAGVTQRGDA